MLSLVIQGPVAIILALLLNQKIRGRSIIRVLIFVPYVISEVIVGTGWSLMLQTNGAVNGLLQDIGLGAFKANWLPIRTSRQQRRYCGCAMVSSDTVGRRPVRGSAMGGLEAFASCETE